MAILSCDTANGVCSVALLCGTEVLAFQEVKETSRQAEELVPMLEAVLEEAGYTYETLEALAVTLGPGSFTGVRIGLSAMRGIKLVTGLPLIGVSTLETTAWHACDDAKGHEILAVLDARREEVFCQRFSSELQPLTVPMLCTYHEAIQLLTPVTIITGEGAPLLAPLTSAPCITPATPAVAVSAAQVAYEKLRAHGVEAYLGSTAPLYIRKPDATLPVSR